MAEQKLEVVAVVDQHTRRCFRIFDVAKQSLNGAPYACAPDQVVYMFFENKQKMDEVINSTGDEIAHYPTDLFSHHFDDSHLASPHLRTKIDAARNTVGGFISIQINAVRRLNKGSCIIVAGYKIEGGKNKVTDCITYSLLG